MSRDPELRISRRSFDEGCQRRQKFRVKAGFRLVERDDCGWARAQQRGGEAEEAKRAVGELARIQRPHQTRLRHPNAKVAFFVVDAQL